MTVFHVFHVRMQHSREKKSQERVVGASAGGLGPWLPLPSHPLCLQNLRTTKAPSLASQGHLAIINFFFSCTCSAEIEDKDE